MTLQDHRSRPALCCCRYCKNKPYPNRGPIHGVKVQFSTSAGSVTLNGFFFFSRLVSDEYEELGSQAHEVARICANKSVTKTSGKDSFYMRVRASCWYTRCWGTLYDTVARVNIGQIILPICYKELNAVVTQEVLRRVRYKFPG
ncbi:ribosomal protein L10e/L16 [Suillus tomentosus]|nr:ribosomal protein L10e/L16 [Suillus tomentosus]